jgi:hypothetical protein
MAAGIVAKGLDFNQWENRRMSNWNWPAYNPKGQLRIFLNHPLREVVVRAFSLPLDCCNICFQLQVKGKRQF